jgi:hypothetical protein
MLPEPMQSLLDCEIRISFYEGDVQSDVGAMDVVFRCCRAILFFQRSAVLEALLTGECGEGPIRFHCNGHTKEAIKDALEIIHTRQSCDIDPKCYGVSRLCRAAAVLHWWGIAVGGIRDSAYALITVRDQWVQRCFEVWCALGDMPSSCIPVRGVSIGEDALAWVRGVPDADLDRAAVFASMCAPAVLVGMELAAAGRLTASAMRGLAERMAVPDFVALATRTRLVGEVASAMMERADNTMRCCEVTRGVAYTAYSFLLCEVSDCRAEVGHSAAARLNFNRSASDNHNGGYLAQTQVSRFRRHTIAMLCFHDRTKTVTKSCEPFGGVWMSREEGELIHPCVEPLESHVLYGLVVFY